MIIKLDPAPGPHEPLVCAVSGGADSMCLLRLLVSGGYDVTAAHFEHGIRGEESLRDAAFVEDWCRGQGIPFVLGHGDTPAFAREKGLGLEEAARVLRYRFLHETAERLGGIRIATAHTLEDNAETVLFHLARGSGAAGLAGIPPESGRLLRPLLHTSRAEIEAYLKENGIPHVEDSTNRSEDYTRNRIRRRLMPLLRELNPRFPEAAARTARLARQDEDCLNSLAADFLRRELRDGSFSLAALRALHPAVAGRVFRLLVPGLSLERTEAALRFAEGTEYALLELPGQVLRREQGRVYLEAEETQALLPRRLIPGESLALPEAGLLLRSEVCRYSGEIHDLFKTSYLKYEILGTELFCTGRMAGDSLRPLGRGCTKKLSALFKEAGLTGAQRALCPVIRDRDGPLLVRGLAMAERAKPERGDWALKITFLA